MKKRLLALILCLTVLVQSAIFSIFAADETDPVYMGAGEHTVVLEADKNTGGVPQQFGKAEADGMVWTDKSIAVNEENFTVTLSALSQEYVSTAMTEAEASSTPADAVMILDMSGSMQDNELPLDGDVNATRTKAMIKAVNEAIDIMMTANSKNRVTVYTFHRSSNSNRSSVCVELLSLGHYTNSSWSRDGVWYSTKTNSASGKYFNYSVSGEEGTISTASGLKKDGRTYTATSESTEGGTCTQQGMAAGISSLVNSINAETHTIDRNPFVLLFTDGAPGAASRNWYSSTPTDQNRTNHSNTGDSEVTALSVLSAAFLKNDLDTAYDTYNGKDTKVEWFNIGLAVGDNEQGRAFMDPYTIYDGTNQSAADIGNYISTYTSGNYSAYSAYRNNYVYAKEHVLFAESGEALENAFSSFAELVEESSKEIKRPIIVKESADATNGLVFTDTIGEGMTLSGITLQADDDTAISGTVSVGASETVYSFSGYETTATITSDHKGRQVLTWRIPVSEVAIYTYKDRKNLGNGEYVAADPIRLTYKVAPTDKTAFNGESLYTNAFTDSKEALAGATYQVGYDNPYYYTVNTDSNGVFQNSSLKNVVFTGTPKEENVTDSASYVIAYSVAESEDHTTVTSKLGNNARAKGVATIQKSVAPQKVRAGESVTYTLRLENTGEAALENLTVQDFLPQGFFYKAGSVTGATVFESGQNLTFGVASVPAGGSTTITYQAVADAGVADGEYVNDAYVQKIDGVAVLNPGHVTATVTVENQYRVIYTWGGDLPDDVTLPTNGNTYSAGSRYPVDTTYTSGTCIEKHDSYGNLTDVWTFSGWDDPNNGTMGDADVTIPGVWTHRSVSVEKHKVFYDWGTQVPLGKVLPTDENTYAKNQPYTVDTNNKAGDTVPTYDAYDNQNGTWTFSGWTDPNQGVMGDTDVTVVGKWTYVPVDVPAHRVIYQWSGKEPPNHTPPVDGSSYVNGQHYTVDTGYTAGMSVPEKDAYGNVTGTYLFSGWTDPNNGVMGNEDVTISGVWTYTAETVPAHRVLYTWDGDIPDDVTLPTDGNSYVKNQPYSVNTEYSYGKEIKAYDLYGNVSGVYVFSGWSDPNNGVMGEEDVTIPGVWVYTEKTVPAHRVFYTWDGDLPDNVTLPTDGNSYVKNQPYLVDGEYFANKEIHEYDSYGNIIGTYTFSGWNDPNNGVMGEADITISGVWTYTPITVPAHRVLYTWEGDVPQSVILPTDENSYVKNQPYSVNKEYTAETELKTYDPYGNVTGIYTFSGWDDPNNGVMGEEDVIIPGVWTYTPGVVPTHRVFYTWDGDIPQGVVLPADENEYVNGQGYTVDILYPAGKEIHTFDVYGNVNGIYTFSGWDDPNNGVMGEEDVIIPGVWTYTPGVVPTHRVLYTWSGDIPEGENLPADENVYVKNQPYEVERQYTAAMEIKDYDPYGNVCGIYTFGGWNDPNNGVMGEADVTIPGVWTYTKKAVPAHRVLYTWCGDIPDDVTLPIDENTYVKGQFYAVDNTYTGETEIKDYHAQEGVIGVYTFSGWEDPNNGTMGEADVTIVGVWKYVPMVIPGDEPEEEPGDDPVNKPDAEPEKESVEENTEVGEKPEEKPTVDQNKETAPKEEETDQKPAGPFTGDTENMAQWFAIMVASGIALLGLLLGRKKNI